VSSSQLRTGDGSGRCQIIRKPHERSPARAFVSARVAVLMIKPSQAALEMARSLIAASQSVPDPDARAVLVNENLRLSLVRFAGADGFVALLRRALALASEQMPMLQHAKIGADGRTEDLDRLFNHDDAVRQEAAAAITAQLLELLVTFIGEPLTRRLVREACPETPAE
jgi:hypothetical protein